MATASDITLSTDAATGTKVFKPLIKEPGSVSYISRDSDISAASLTLRLAFRPATNNRLTNRVNGSLAMPLKRSDGGDPATYSAADVARFSCEWVLPDTMSQSERDAFGFMIRDMVSESAIQAATDDLDPPV